MNIPPPVNSSLMQKSRVSIFEAMADAVRVCDTPPRLLFDQGIDGGRYLLPQQPQRYLIRHFIACFPASMSLFCFVEMAANSKRIEGFENF